MKLYGLQKMTLLDFPGHVACTVFTGGCDLRCPFCHNYELAECTAPPVMEEEEFFAFLSRRKGLLDGVAITGGEPCLQRTLPGFLQKIRELDFSVKLDTNGLHPEMLSRLLENGLVDYVAMDIKNAPEKYARTSGVPAVDPAKIEQSIALLIEGPADYEFRTTVVSQLHETEDFYGIGRMLQGAKRYFLQAFTDRDAVPFAGFTAPSKEELLSYAAIVESFGVKTALRGVD